MPKYIVNLMHVFEVEGDDEQEALHNAEDYLMEMAGSNDGSELLANARPTITPY